MNRRDPRRRLVRLTALALCAALLGPVLVSPTSADLTDRTLQLEQAQSMAVSTSSAITKQKNQIILKQMKYVEAVEGIRAKVKNLRSFRWSPLLSFKFPEQLTLTEEYELNIKPLTLQTEIDTLQHGLDSLKYDVTDKVTQQYFKVYLLQETTAFTQERLDDAKAQLSRNQAGLSAGTATQSDVDKAKTRVETLTSSLANELREFENAKKTLSDLIGMDVTVGYVFTNGYKSADIPRSLLDSLIQYTLDHDQTFYEAKTTTATALLNVEAYEGFMRQQYGSKMDIIQTYVNMAKQGMDVDQAAFQLKYKEMLAALDKPWNGKIKILFFRFTKEWFKGEIDGTRYIEDEMYAVYTACTDYSNARKDQETAEKNLRSDVANGFETLVTNWNSYLNSCRSTETAKRELDQALLLNREGKATYTEVSDKQDAYQEAQLNELQSLHDYNLSLSEYNKTTCGAVSKYFKDAGASLNTGEGGDAYAVLDPINDPYYYIYTSVADLKFSIGVSIPDGFEPAIDSFEVWYAGTQIGTRTTVGTELHHLALDYKETSTLTIRLYNGGTYVDECEIDASIPRDVLDIQRAETDTAAERIIGSYSVETYMEGNVSMSELTLSVNATENAAYYTLSYDDAGIYTTDLRSVSESFPYLTLLISSLDEVSLQLYDRNQQPLTQARFDPDTQQLLALNT